jgi:CRISPR/Cas system-associated endonuclease Cas1
LIPQSDLYTGTTATDFPLILDLMEPLRPVVDGNILPFALSHVFTPGDFTIGRTGACRVNPQMAKQIVKHCSVLERIRPVVRLALKSLKHSA